MTPHWVGLSSQSYPTRNSLKIPSITADTNLDCVFATKTALFTAILDGEKANRIKKMK